MSAQDPGIDLDPAAAKTAAARMHNCGDELERARRTAGEQLAVDNAAKPWGKDEMGTAFEKGKDGKDGYLATAESVLAAWLKFSTRTSQLGVDIVRAVDNLTGADEAGDAQVKATLTHAPPGVPL